MKYYVYLITNDILNKKYVGSRKSLDPDNDNYWGSSRFLKEDFRIFGKENFSKEILEYYSNISTMLDGESELILKHNTLAPKGYNRFLPNQRKGFHMAGYKHSEETKKKIRNTTKESCKNMNKGEKNPMYGRTPYDIWVLKFGKEIADQKQKTANEKHSKSMMGVHKGRIVSEETKRKMSESAKKRWENTF